MTDDEGSETKKDIAARPTSVPAETRPQYPASPVHERSLFGRVWSRFVAGLNTKTIEANTDEVRAHKAYAKERGELADTMLEADRKISHYLYHRDDILQSDHAAHLDGMEENAHQIELNRLRRDQTLLAAKADGEKAAMQHHFDHKIAAQTNEAALAQAEWQTHRAQWGRDAFQQSMTFRRERIEHLYKTGALDQEIERLIAEGSRDELLGGSKKPASSGAPSSPDASALATLERLLAELDEEINTAHATHASDDHKAALYGMRARITAKIVNLKGP